VVFRFDDGKGRVRCKRADVCFVFEPRRSLDDATGVVGVCYADDVGEASVSADYLC
jgi:hypothetical protein